MRDPAKRDPAKDGDRLAAPSDWVVRFHGGIPARGRVLDIACGPGRHFPLLLADGRRVVGIDRDIQPARVRWPEGGGVTLVEADLENGGPMPFDGDRFEGVVVTNYLWRPILPAIVAAVAGDGVLLYETFGIGQERIGRPRNPDFLLQPCELLDAVGQRLRVIAFEHVHLRSPDRIVQRIAAVGAGHPWPHREAPPA